MRTGPNFNYKCIADLPSLSWCMQFEQESSTVNVTHGSGVETSDDWFCEGAWSNSFDLPDFDKKFMTGTGAKFTKKGLLLVTPSHTLDRILILRKDDCMYVSNSLSFLLAWTNENLDSKCIFYDAYWTSIRDGLKHYKKYILTESKQKICLYYSCNIIVAKNLAVQVEPKKCSPEFLCYSDYKDYLISCATELIRNADDDKRKIKYSSLATLSTGYDSPASAVIAKYAGCQNSITFNDSRDGYGDKDCGTEIAGQLGMGVKEFSRFEYRNFNGFPEVENSGGPNEFLSFGDVVSRKILITGYAGDTTWDKNCNYVGRDLTRAGGGGGSVTEFRLRTGFFQLPIPLIAADSHPSIHNISNSEEMDAWSMNNLYDRPIARRLVEDSGVSRTAFGQLKKAAGVVVSFEGLASTMSEQSLVDFNKYYDENWTLKNSLKLYPAKILNYIVKKNRRLSYLVYKSLRKMKIELPRVPMLIPRSLRIYTYGYLGKESMLFHWGVDKLIEKYQSAIKSQNSYK